METKQKIIAKVKSPSKNAYLREGRGFSLSEIEETNKSVKLLEDLNIKIDYFRKSAHPTNVEKLKSLEIPKKKGKKREPFVKKEKKKTPYKPKIEKRKVKKPVKPKAPPKKVVIKEKAKPLQKEKPIKKEIGIKKEEGTSLTELTGLGAATANKLIELGVNNVEELVKENPEELATLIKGVSLDRLTKWIEEGKSLLK
ncbi:MAG: helix-hairpin-helix domain-containing protein [Candidatus Hermodarchaeota archaeon]